MAFLRAARPAGREWSVEEAAVYAARRDYELLKLLSRDKRALHTARLLGVPLGEKQHQPFHDAAAANAAAQQQAAQPGSGSAGSPFTRKNRRRPNEARRQKQQQRFEEKRMKQKLLAVLPIVNKWAQAQQRADAAITAAPQPSTLSLEQQGSRTGDDAAMMELQERPMPVLRGGLVGYKYSII